MHDDQDLDKKNKEENQKTGDDENIFLTLVKLDSPELRKWLMFGIGLALVLIVLVLFLYPICIIIYLDKERRCRV